VYFLWCGVRSSSEGAEACEVDSC